MARPEVFRKWPGPPGWIRGREPLLRDHQARAVAVALEALEGRGNRQLLRARRGVVLADEVGMGKTREAIAAAILFLSRNAGSRPMARDVLFFVPPSLRRKWDDELQMFTTAVRRQGRVSKGIAGAVRALADRENIVIESTSKVGRYADAQTSERAIARNARLIIVDEAHKARNAHSVLHASLKKIIARSQRRRGPSILLLTATPFQCDHHRELVNLLSLLDRGWSEGEGGPEDGRGFKSIVGAIEYGLNRLARDLKKWRDCGEAPAEALQKLLKCLDENLDLDHDPHGKTFGVVTGHDGFDEYLRSLVIRNTKPRVDENQRESAFKAVDVAMYLFGRAYLRRRSRGEAGCFGDPPPGGGFLPNGYSRLCSTFASQKAKRVSGKRPDSHQVLIARRAQRESLADPDLTHTKLRHLLEFLARDRPTQLGHKAAKVVVFVNHIDTLRQIRFVLKQTPWANGLLAREQRSEPLKRDVAHVGKSVGRGWTEVAKNLVNVGLKDEDVAALRAAVTRHLALIKRERLKFHWRYIKAVLVDVAIAASGKRRNSVRGRIRRELVGDHGRRSQLGSDMPIRTFGAVEHLSGETDMRRRQRLLRAFNCPGVTPFILVVSQAGSEGQDMHGACRRVIHFDLHWNPTVVHQRTGRVHRDKIEAHEVLATQLVCGHGYDETIRRYARTRDAYRDFLLGEKTLRQFLEDQAVYDGKLRSWRIDLEPDPLK